MLSPFGNAYYCSFQNATVPPRRYFNYVNLLETIMYVSTTVRRFLKIWIEYINFFQQIVVPIGSLITLIPYLRTESTRYALDFSGKNQNVLKTFYFIFRALLRCTDTNKKRAHRGHQKGDTDRLESKPWKCNVKRNIRVFPPNFAEGQRVSWIMYF